MVSKALITAISISKRKKSSIVESTSTFFPQKRAHVAICKLNFPLCVLPFGEHLHFIFRKSRDFVMFEQQKKRKKTIFLIRVVEAFRDRVRERVRRSVESRLGSTTLKHVDRMIIDHCLGVIRRKEILK